MLTCMMRVSLAETPHVDSRRPGRIRALLEPVEEHKLHACRARPVRLVREDESRRLSVRYLCPWRKYLALLASSGRPRPPNPRRRKRPAIRNASCIGQSTQACSSAGSTSRHHDSFLHRRLPPPAKRESHPCAAGAPPIAMAALPPSEANSPSSAAREDDSQPDVGQPAAKKRRTATSRGVANLTPEQLARKRANDREAQRAIRERTKTQIDRLNQRIRDLESQQPYHDLQVVLREKEAVQAENADIRKRLESVVSIIQPILRATGGLNGQYGCVLLQLSADKSRIGRRSRAFAPPHPPTPPTPPAPRSAPNTHRFPSVPRYPWRHCSCLAAERRTLASWYRRLAPVAVRQRCAWQPSARLRPRQPSLRAPAASTADTGALR